MKHSVKIYTSTRADGSMSKAVTAKERFTNRKHFLARHRIGPEQTILVYLTYGGDDYRRYKTIDSSHAGDGIARPSTMEVDALFTKDESVALLLPIADCVATVLYDKQNQVLGLAHLGRHNLLQQGGVGAVEYMKAGFGTNAADVEVWLSAAAGKQNYPLFDFENRSLHEVAREQLARAGVLPVNITLDSRDTTVDMNLFSHSEFLKGNRQLDGRIAVVAQL